MGDITGALLVAESMRAAVENLRITHRFSRANGVVTISIGAAAVIPGRGDAGSVRLIKAADDALYQAKQAGRNRIAAEPLPWAADAPCTGPHSFVS